jgi:hypothetical protein
MYFVDWAKEIKYSFNIITMIRYVEQYSTLVDPKPKRQITEKKNHSSDYARKQYNTGDLILLQICMYMYFLGPAASGRHFEWKIASAQTVGPGQDAQPSRNQVISACLRPPF